MMLVCCSILFYRAQLKDTANPIELTQSQQPESNLNALMNSANCVACRSKHNCPKDWDDRKMTTCSINATSTITTSQPATTTTIDVAATVIDAFAACRHPSAGKSSAEQKTKMKNKPIERATIVTQQLFSQCPQSMIDLYGSIDSQPLDNHHLLNLDLDSTAQVDLNKNRTEFVSMDSCHGWPFQSKSLSGMLQRFMKRTRLILNH